MFERSLENVDVKYRKIDFSSSNSLRHCLQRGIGITICPEIAIRQEIQEGGPLKRLKTVDIISETPVVMIWHIDKWCSPLLQRFIDLTKNVIKE